MFPFLSTLAFSGYFLANGLTSTSSVVDSWVCEPQGLLCTDGASGGDRKVPLISPYPLPPPGPGAQLLSDSAKSRRGGRRNPTNQG